MEKENETKYVDDINLCVGRIKEVFPNAKIDRVDELNVEFKFNLGDDRCTLYDVNTHTLYVDNEKIEKSADSANRIMHGVLDVVTTDKNTKETGVIFDEKMDCVNRGINNMISNILIPSDNENIYDFESSTIANLLTVVVGSDVVLDSYFNSNGKKMYNELLKKYGNDAIRLDTMLEFSNIELSSVSDREYPSLLGYIQSGISESYLKNNNVSLEEANKFTKAMFTDSRCAPDGYESRLTPCNYCDVFAKDYCEKLEQIEKSKAKASSHSKELDDMFSDVSIHNSNMMGVKK